MRNRLFAGLGAMAIAVVGLSSPAIVSRMQGGPLVLLDGENQVICADGLVPDGFRFIDNEMWIICDGVLVPTETATQLPTYTATVVSTVIPTDTRLPSNTPTLTSVPPSATIPPGASIMPFRAAPYCAHVAMNDDGQVREHGGWDYSLGCWYDHEHGESRELGRAVFGDLVDRLRFDVTHNTGALENTMKHAGNKIIYDDWTYQNCDPSFRSADIQIPTTNCLTHSLLRNHLVSTIDGITDTHSFDLLVRVCAPPFTDPSKCGIMYRGGQNNWGSVHAPFYKTYYPRTNKTVTFLGMTMQMIADPTSYPKTSGESYVFYTPRTEANGFDQRMRFRNSSPSATSDSMEQWSSNDWDCEPKRDGAPCNQPDVHYAIELKDTFGLFDTANPFEFVNICFGEVGCEYNGTLYGVPEMAVRVRASWDTQDGNPNDGFVTAELFTDRFGNVVSGCTVDALDCVRLILINMPVGMASVNVPGCKCKESTEFDYYYNTATGLVNPLPGKPAGPGWRTVGKIKFPN